MPNHVFQSSGDLLADRRYDYALACLDDGDAVAAADLAAQAVEIAPLWAAGWMLLGKARLASGDDAGARQAFASALAADPDDRLGAAVEMAAMGADAADGGGMSHAYVASLFDAYAPRFDAHLDALGYRAPALIAERIVPLAPFGRVLDLGCGTGLLGPPLRPHVAWLAGCDLSAAMVAQARARGVYDDLEVGDLHDMLDAQPDASLGLVAAADVFVYVGDLARVFAGAAHALAPGGVFAFTVQEDREAGGSHGYRIGADRRFHHRADYLSTLAEGRFAVAALDRATLRMDRGEPVAGLVAVMRRL